MKKIIMIVLVMCLFSSNVFATDDIYSRQYEASGTSGLYSQLPDDAQNIFDGLDISTDEMNWTDTLTVKNVFSMIGDILSGKGAKPLASLCGMLCIILLASFLSGLAPNQKPDAAMMISYVSTISISAVLLLPLIGTIQTAVAAIKGCSVFMLSFVPVYAGILLSQGNAAVSAGFSGVMLTVCELITQASSFLILPLVGMHLAVSLASAVSPSLNTASLGDLLKKTATWGMSLAMTVLLSILGIQTVIGTATDTAAIKTAKFVASSSIPVVGAAVSEAMTTVKSCLSVLSSSVAVYGVVAVAACLLPVILELVLWRVCILMVQSAADIFGETKSSSLLKAVDTSISFLIAIIFSVFILFVISLTLVVMLGGKS